VGGDLMSLLRQDVRLPEASIHDFGRDMVVALQYLHASSIIYCDIKPSNVLLDENGRLKLGGFGLSRRLSDISKSAAASVPPVRKEQGRFILSFASTVDDAWHTLVLPCSCDAQPTT
jgi:serine/threonine-protein kinase ULK4